MCWEPNWILMPEQEVLLTTKPSLQQQGAVQAGLGMWPSRLWLFSISFQLALLQRAIAFCMSYPWCCLRSPETVVWYSTSYLFGDILSHYCSRSFTILFFQCPLCGHCLFCLFCGYVTALGDFSLFSVPWLGNSLGDFSLFSVPWLWGEIVKLREFSAEST